MSAKMDLLERDGDFLLVRVCLIDENGDEIPHTYRYIVFELPNWIQKFQSASEPDALAALKKLVQNAANAAHPSRGTTFRSS